MRNEILASKQRNKKYAHSTYRRTKEERIKREKSKESSILCGKKDDPSETCVRK